MAQRGPDWAMWVEGLPATLDGLVDQWELTADGPPGHGHCSVVLPVRTADRAPALLKVGFPEQESEHEHLALRRWAGDGAVRLLSADPHTRALLLERLSPTDLTSVPDVEACAIVAGRYGRIHVPPLPQVRPLSSFIERWAEELRRLPRSAPIPRRLVEQALTLGRQLCADGDDRLLHTDLHYANVLAADRAPWLVIDPKPLNGDPHYEVAPMLWNRFAEIRSDVRAGVRRRFWTLVDTAGFDPDRARDWVTVRMVHNALWALQNGTGVDRDWLTVCIAVAKAVGD